MTSDQAILCFQAARDCGFIARVEPNTNVALELASLQGDSTDYQVRVSTKDALTRRQWEFVANLMEEERHVEVTDYEGLAIR